MSDQTNIESLASEQKSRRAAIRTAAQVAVTAPAVGLLLSAGTKSAFAAATYDPKKHTKANCTSGDDCVAGDDYVSPSQHGDDFQQNGDGT